MLSNVVAIPRHQNPVRVSGRLKAFLLSGLTAAVLLLGTGLTIASATAAVLGVTAGGLGAAYESCQRVEANLAGDLGLSIAALRTAEPAALADRVVARQGANALTALAAARASDRVNAYSSCRQLFLNPTAGR